MMERTRYDHLENLAPKLGPHHRTIAESLFEWPEASLMDHSRAMVVGGETLAVAGVSERTDPHYLAAWLFVTEEAVARPLSLMRFAKACIADLDGEFKPRRLEMTVRVDRPQDYEFAEVLGLEYEGLLRAYGADGTDHYLLARVRP